MERNLSVHEILDIMSQGSTLQEALMGKDWKSKYPNRANFPGLVSYNTSPTGWIIRLHIDAETKPHFFHTMQYIVAEKTFPPSAGANIYQAIDDVIRDWMEEHSMEAVRPYQQAWNPNGEWENLYPHILAWINQGKRHCIRISINCVSGKNNTKAWQYNKKENSEQILLEEETQGLTESEVLRRLDNGIAAWLQQHEGSVP